MKPSSLFVFLKTLFFQKSVMIIRAAYLQKNYKTVMIICSVMIQWAFLLKTFFIKKSLLRVKFHGPRCIPDTLRGFTRFTPLGHAKKRKVKWISTHRHPKIYVFVPIYSLAFWNGPYTHAEICSSIGVRRHSVEFWTVQ